MDLSLIVAGFFVGVVVGLTGVGGGSLMTPFLIFYGINPVVAVGTDLVFAAITKSGGVIAHHRAGTVRWKIVALLAAGSLPASVVAVAVLAYLQARGLDFGVVITRCLSVALVLSGFVLLFRDQVARASWHPRYAALHAFKDTHPAPLTVFAGLLLGMLVTLSSVGAGALGVSILLAIYPRLPAVQIVGTDLAHAVPLAAVAGFGYWQLGRVDALLLLALLLGSLPGIFVGAWLSVRFPERLMRTILGGMLLAVGFGFMFR